MTEARHDRPGPDQHSVSHPESSGPRHSDSRAAALPGTVSDLRRVGIAPDHWYPVATSRKVRRNRTFAAVFAGERIVLYRGRSGVVHALEDRCAHRQVPLSLGVVEGDVLRCCYHAWAYRGDGRISQIPYLPKGCERPPRGVRSYPVREAYGLVFVFPGDPALAEDAPFPFLPEYHSATHRTMTFSRTVRCHYSFMHENLLDMNHQFLHRSVLGRIRPELLGYDAGPRHVEARYLFVPAGGRKDRGAGLLSAEGFGGQDRPDVITIRTEYPYQTLRDVPEGSELPVFSLWAAYVPEDAEQRINHAYGLLTIAKPSVPGALHLAWPLIRRFTERVFAQDRTAVEAEQRAWDEQGEDHNHEVFPLILDLRDVLRSNGVPLRPEQASGCAPCGMASPAHHAAAVTGDAVATDHAGVTDHAEATDLGDGTGFADATGHGDGTGPGGPAQSAGPAVEGAGRSE